MSEKTKSQKRREQRKRAKERKRMASVEASEIGRWADRATKQMDKVLGIHLAKERTKPFLEGKTVEWADTAKRGIAHGGGTDGEAFFPRPGCGCLFCRGAAGAEPEPGTVSAGGKAGTTATQTPEEATTAEAEVLRLRAQVAELVNRNGESEAKSGNLMAEVRRLEKVGAELERIAAHRLDELVEARARVLELEERTVEVDTWGLKLLQSLGEFLRVATTAQGPQGISIIANFPDSPGQPVLHIWATNDDQEPVGRCRLLAAERDAARARVAARENELSAATAAIEGNLRRIAELEPLAEVGRRMEELPLTGHVRHHTTSECQETWTITWKKGLNITGAPTLLDALRAAGIGEGVGHG